ERARVDEVHLEHAVVAAGPLAHPAVIFEAARVGGTQRDVDDAAHHAAEARAEVARIKVDLLEQLRGHDAREAAEVVRDRDQRAVGEDVRVVGGRTADDQEPRQPRRPRHARQRLERAQGVAARPGYALDLAALNGPARDL